jgi:hypothetical protein
MTPWAPSESDMQWQAALFASMKDGGTWLCPMDQSIWQINKQTKTLRQIMGEDSVTAGRIKICSELIGYAVEMKNRNN